MNPEIGKKWIEALRSGKYKQGRFCLYDGEKMCCLGVLCDIHSKETGNEWKFNPSPNKIELDVYTYLDAIAALPKEVVMWASLNSAVPMLQNKILVTLANDRDNWSFEEIANAIESSIAWI